MMFARLKTRYYVSFTSADPKQTFELSVRASQLWTKGFLKECAGLSNLTITEVIRYEPIFPFSLFWEPAEISRKVING